MNPDVKKPEPGPKWLKQVVNMVNPETGAVEVAQSQADVKRWADLGFRVARESTIKLTPKSKSDLQKRLLDTDEQSARLDRINDDMNPKFLELPFQAKMAWYRGQEKLGITLSEEERQELDEYTGFQSGSTEALNLYIKDITGATMGVEEAGRLKKALPNTEDSPTEFAAKFKLVMANLKAANERYRKKLSPEGLGNKTGVNPSIGPMTQQEAPEPQEERGVDPEQLSPDNPYREALMKRRSR